MARKRMIDPAIWEDEHFGSLSDRAKILFIACISNADDDGRLSANPANLRAISFRFDEDIKIVHINTIRDEISKKMKNFKVYNVSGSEYIQLQKWETYQTQRDDRRKPSNIPDVSQESDKCQPNDNQCPLKVSKLSKGSKDKKDKDEEYLSLIKTFFQSIDYSAYKSRYSNIDLKHEFSKAKMWLEEHLTAKDKKSNFKLFLLQWLDRIK